MPATANRDRAPERRDSIALREAAPKILLLDERYGIAFAQPGAKALLSGVLKIPEHYMDRLPVPIELAIQDAIRGMHGGKDVILEPVPELRMCVSMLEGRGGEAIIAVQVERKIRRQSLSSATKRFKLTAREAEVLALVMRGKSGAEIAAELSIAETTVADYVKRIMRKTESKNRAEMLASIFAWQPEDEQLQMP